MGSYIERTGDLYDTMTKRFFPAKDKKTGIALKYKMRLPFTKEQFRAWMRESLPGEIKRCPHCQSIISWDNGSPDHMTPVNRGGNLTLENLELICLGCNKAKGQMTRGEFQSLMVLLNTFAIPGKNDVLSRLKNGQGFLRLKRGG